TDVRRACRCRRAALIRDATSPLAGAAPAQVRGRGPEAGRFLPAGGLRRCRWTRVVMAQASAAVGGLGPSSA
ncbi:hypothetical protein, partial [Cellulomonas septica]|uniref:hypothetical protein n=1 Tax=Cellulomonas septica TaxID=285080 RepID=UPI001B34FF2E